MSTLLFLWVYRRNKPLSMLEEITRLTARDLPAFSRVLLKRIRQSKEHLIDKLPVRNLSGIYAIYAIYAIYPPFSRTR